MEERERWLRARAIFEAALDLEPEQRPAFIARVSAGDEGLRREVMSLLEAHEQDRDFLEIPAAYLNSESLEAWMAGSALGKRFGSYLAVATIAQGGMSTVYLGERADREYIQRVCIKLIRPGFESEMIVRRFVAERQILARLEHPNIARLLDGGRTEEGLPYFVMEYVDGVRIDEYCDAQGLGIPERLALFCKICEAVHYAHQNLVIHRDIKPGNILVDEAGEPKLLDFGIAKLLAPDALGLPAETTLTSLRAMTPQYASPEQVRGGVISTASDVYSLGVLLYELLAGYRPYDAPSLTPEAMRAVCENDPEKPSTAVAREVVDTDRRGESIALTPQIIALCRRCTPGRLRRLLEGDLDNIVLKAMRKEPERRYTSAEQLAEDIRRHLRGLPVGARSDTFSYRATKFVRRNRSAVVAFFLATVALVTGTGIALWQSREARLSEIGALRASAEAMSASHRQLEALLSAVKARRLVGDTPGVPDELQARTTDTLEEILDRLREINRLEGHTGWVSSVAFSPRGDRLVSGSREAILWNLDGKVLHRLDGHGDWVNAVAFSPDGSLVLTASRDRTLKIWNAADGRLLRTFRGHSGAIYGAAFAPDGRTIASGGKDRTVRIWDAATGRTLRILRGHVSTVYAVSFSPDGKVLASSSRDRTVRLWRADDGMPLGVLRGHTDTVRRVVFSPDSATLASVSDDRTVRLWRADGLPQRTISGHGDAVWGVAFSPNGQLLATGCDDNAIRIWNLDGTLVETILGHNAGVNSMAFSPDGKTLATASADKTVRLWLLDTAVLQTIPARGGTLQSVAFSPSGNFFAVGGDMRTVRLYSRDGRFIKELIGHTDNVRSVTFSPDGHVIASAGDDGSARLWSVDGRSLGVVALHSASIAAVRFSPDGQILATAGNDRTVRLWRLDGELLHTLTGHRDGVYDVRFGPDGLRIASVGFDGAIRFWTRDGIPVGIGGKHTAALLGLSFSPDGSTIATGGADGQIGLWDRQGKLKASFTGHENTIYTVQFAPTGDIVASGSEDGTVKLWQLDGKLVRTLHSRGAPVRSIAFDSSGSILAAARTDGSIDLWHWRRELEQPLLRSCRLLGNYLVTNPNIWRQEAYDACKGILTDR